MHVPPRQISPGRRREALRATLLLLAAGSFVACGDSGGGRGRPTYPSTGDPGVAAWQAVPRERVAAECKLDPDLLDAADARLDRQWAVVRYGKLCHEFYPDGPAQAEQMTEIFSATKTLGVVVTGVAAYQTRDLRRTGRKTGPLSDDDRVDQWLDEFSFNPDAHIAHVLAMVAHNPDLSFGKREYVYDTIGTVQINRLSDVINTAIAQDPERLGHDLEEFTQRFLFQPLGLEHSQWDRAKPDKAFAYGWQSTVRDMARIGLLLLHGGTWSGERILDEGFVYRLTHPAFEDANTGYGYLTWLNAASNYTFGQGDGKHDGPGDPCAPVAVNQRFPHGLSEARDCGYAAPYSCEQGADVGIWYADGALGQFIVGHRGLDLLLVVKNLGEGERPRKLWDAVRPALVALDPKFAGDEAAFCASYSRGEYTPDLH